MIYLLRKKRAVLKPLLLLLLPFIIIDSAWIVRNYNIHKKFIPLNNGQYYPYLDSSYMRPMTGFVQAWGGASGMLSPNSAISWFGGLLFPDEPTYKNYDSVPDYIYTSYFNHDSILKLRELTHIFISMQKPTVDSLWDASGHDWNKAFCVFYTRLKPRTAEAAAYQREIIRRFNVYTESIKKDKPFLYYVKAPLIFIKDFLYQPNEVYFKRGQIPKIGPVIESFNRIFYMILLNLGLIGMILLMIKGFKVETAYIISVIPVWTILVYPIIERMGDNRYLIPAWPFLLACAAYVINLIFKKARREKVKML